MVDFPEIPEDDIEEEEAEELAPANELINAPINKLRIHKRTQKIEVILKESRKVRRDHLRKDFQSIYETKSLHFKWKGF